MRPFVVRKSAILALLTVSSLQVASADDGAATRVSASELKAWVSYLSSDELKGRANGTVEIARAATWIAERYREFGLEPPSGQSGYIQEFDPPEKHEALGRLRNVIGYLEGTDPKLKDEFILFTAHYDHIGVDPKLEGDNILNGADDNASGVAAIIGVAATLHGAIQADPGSRPRRSIVFIAFSGEELGSLGASFYTEHPLFPLEKTVVDLNLEMVGHSDGRGPGRVWVTGSEFSDLIDIMRDTAKTSGWRVEKDPYPKMNLFFRSDNTQFIALNVDREKGRITGVPAHSLSTWGQEGHYHEPSDEAESLDFENMQGLVELLSSTAKALANRDDWVSWKKRKLERSEQDYTFGRP